MGLPHYQNKPYQLDSAAIVVSELRRDREEAMDRFNNDVGTTPRTAASLLYPIGTTTPTSDVLNDMIAAATTTNLSTVPSIRVMMIHRRRQCCFSNHTTPPAFSNRLRCLDCRRAEMVDVLDEALRITSGFQSEADNEDTAAADDSRGRE